MYAKVFKSMFDGTLRGQSDGILVFVNLLACADREGFVDRHYRAISEETGLSMDRVESAIKMLESPDADSRSQELEGRRIEKIDSNRGWGWRIINYVKYREMKNAEERAAYNREAQRRSRERRATADNQATSGDKTGQHSSTPVINGQHASMTSDDVELPPRFPRTLADAMNMCGGLACPPEVIEESWNKAVGRGGRDSKDVVIRSWPAYMANELKYHRERTEKEKTNGRTGRHKTVSEERNSIIGDGKNQPHGPGGITAILKRREEKREQESREVAAKNQVAEPIPSSGKPSP